MTWIAIQARFTLIVKTCKHMCNQATQAINKRSIKIFKIFACNKYASALFARVPLMGSKTYRIRARDKTI